MRTLLQSLVNERHLTQRQVRERLRERARELAIADRDFDLSERQFSRLIAGEVATQPRPVVCRVLEAEFGYSIQELLREVAPADDESSARTVLELAASSSSEFAMWQSVDDLLATTLMLRLSTLTNNYVNSEMIPVVQGLNELRSETVSLLKRGGPHSRALYSIAGVCSAVMAHGVGNLGHLEQAPWHVNAALRFAELAESDVLAAWALGVTALQSEWSGYPSRSLQDITAATARLPGDARQWGSTGVWLAAIEARAQARLGNQEGVNAALTRVAERRDALSGEVPPSDVINLDHIGGIVSFGLPKQHYYAGTALRRIGSYPASRRESTLAIEGYESGPPSARSYGDETLARLDLAIAHVQDDQPDLDAAAEAFAHIAALPAAMLLPTYTGHLKELAAVTSIPRLRRAAVASSLNESAREIAQVCQPSQANKVGV